MLSLSFDNVGAVGLLLNWGDINLAYVADINFH